MFEAVIGLEVHAQLLTRTKLFCGCRVAFGVLPNTNVCPVCLGLPGALPVPNARAIELGVRAARALGSRIEERSTFARKQYFYPDLPKGYQISQFDKPFAVGGTVEYVLEGEEKSARLVRVHLEEDAGKSTHRGQSSLVDLNRAGTPLIEIVGEPDLRSPQEAAAYLRALREILMALEVNDGNLEEGSFRCDANVSVRPRGESKLGTRVELKNINSFRFIERAIAGEIDRQIEEIGAGRIIVQETRGYDEVTDCTYSMRGKEDAHDYRYFADPDLPTLGIPASMVAAVDAALPELPAKKRARYTQDLGLPADAAAVLTGHPRVAALFEESVAFGAPVLRAANFVQAEVLRDVTTDGLAATIPLSARQLADILVLVERTEISGKQAKELYAKVRGTDRAVPELVNELGMKQVTDVGQIAVVCQRVVAANEKQAASYRAGKTTLFGFFVGQVMKEMRGAAHPETVRAELEKALGAPAPGAS